ncbi:MAG: tRNA (adenosine(37)-N6)-dimethylallyltransferase MiaA [Candidatus Omnitrophica bacterium]|nr:tRNA (adenosine(37)-N6)-dimethylallyltransferase MiaA [Candidatus Omnitrophota bacterium]MDD5592016.1 tRNA (adenosine(37)-N6)-dimethylallyltransferase MiaA [Candidatus Omnitrophota bacterium]
MKPKIVFLVGPTAIGKTDIALALAKKIKAEIISCDSMQVYRGADILTSKPPAALRKAIPHHLINMVSADKEYNVSRYYKDVAAKVKEIIGRGKIPLIVGGTGLYMSILIDGIFKSRPICKVRRSRFYKEAETKGSGYLYSKLKGIDPDAALKIHPHDTKRIIRALEVYAATGKPISSLQRQRQGLKDEYDVKIFCLNMERDKLYRRIDGRVDKMFIQGAVSEAKKLLKLKLSRTAGYALGIREIKGYLDGLYDLEEAKRLLKKNTRNYAKRQLTWFRKDKRIQWIEISEKQKPQHIVNRIVRMF